jgi:hypothetical protein
MTQASNFALGRSSRHELFPLPDVRRPWTLSGSYTWEFIGVGRLKGERLEVTWNTKEGEEDGAESRTLSLRRRNGLVRAPQQKRGRDRPVLRTASQLRGRLSAGARRAGAGRGRPSENLPAAT